MLLLLSNYFASLLFPLWTKKVLSMKYCASFRPSYGTFSSCETYILRSFLFWSSSRLSLLYLSLRFSSNPSSSALSLYLIMNLAGEHAFFEGTLKVIKFFGMTSMLRKIFSERIVCESSAGITRSSIYLITLIYELAVFSISAVSTLSSSFIGFF